MNTKIFGLVLLFTINSWCMEIDKFPINNLLVDKTLDQKLKTLQVFANILVFQSESYQSLKKIVSVMEVLHELQQYRIIDTEGKQFLSAYRLTDDNEIHEKYTQIAIDNSRMIHVLNVYLPQAQALALQIGHYLSDWKLKGASKGHTLDQYIQNENENIRVVAGMTKHYLYSYQLAHLVFAAPRGLATYNEQIRNNHLLDCLKIDPSLKQALRPMSPMWEMVKSLAQLLEYYRASGHSDDFFECYIGTDCLNEMDNAKKIIVQFEKIIPKFQRLYERVRSEIAQLINQNYKQDRNLQKETRISYNRRLFELFNTNSSIKLVKPEDLALHYPSNPELPLILECSKISSLSIFSSPSLENSKFNFIPVALSKSGPTARKKGLKKRNQSEPSSRSKSPNLLEPIENDKHIEVKIEHDHVEELQYDNRVLRWFDPLTQDEVVLRANDESIEYHCFTRLVDNYLIKYGIQTPWQNKAKSSRAKECVMDINYSLGGSIERSDREKKYVVFSCCKDQQNIIYHRGIDEKKNNTLFVEYFEQNKWNVFHRDEFPELGKIYKTELTLSQLQSSENDEIISEDELCIKIMDNHLKMTIILFRPLLTQL